MKIFSEKVGEGQRMASGETTKEMFPPSQPSTLSEDERKTIEQANKELDTLYRLRSESQLYEYIRKATGVNQKQYTLKELLTIIINVIKRAWRARPPRRYF